MLLQASWYEHGRVRAREDRSVQHRHPVCQAGEGATICLSLQEEDEENWVSDLLERHILTTPSARGYSEPALPQEPQAQRKPLPLPPGDPLPSSWAIYDLATYPGASGSRQSQRDGRKGGCALQSKLGQGALLHHQALGQGRLHQTQVISLLLRQWQSSAWAKQLKHWQQKRVAEPQLPGGMPGARTRGTGDPQGQHRHQET